MSPQLDKALTSLADTLDTLLRIVVFGYCVWFLWFLITWHLK